MGNSGINIVCGFEQIRDRFWRQYDMYIMPKWLSKQRGWYRWCNPVLQQYQESCMDRQPGERHNADGMHRH